MSKLYVAAPGRTIPGGWPEAGRAIDELSRMHRRFIQDGDLIEKPDAPARTKRPASPDLKKENTHGE
jgi:hypothetical protein